MPNVESRAKYTFQVSNIFHVHTSYMYHISKLFICWKYFISHHLNIRTHDEQIKNKETSKVEIIQVKYYPFMFKENQVHQLQTSNFIICVVSTRRTKLKILQFFFLRENRKKLDYAMGDENSFMNMNIQNFRISYDNLFCFFSRFNPTWFSYILKFEIR